MLLDYKDQTVNSLLLHVIYEHTQRLPQENSGVS
jgi:hypothetical protein